MKKAKFFVLILSIMFCALFLFSCENMDKNEEGPSVNPPSLPLEEYEGEYLYGEIPTPKDADIYVFTNSEDSNWLHYSYTFENFTQEEAIEYIKLLEASVVQKRILYDVYYGNDYPILNYSAYLKGGGSISLSHCHNNGNFLINIEK